MSRATTAVAATVTAAALAFTAAPATAGENARALPEREITIDVDQIDATPNAVKVAITGKATDWPNKKVTLQTRKGGEWKPVDTTKTNDNAKYRFTRWLKTGTHKFRVKTAKGGGYKTSYSPVFSGTVT